MRAMTEPRIAAIILAAGASTRMGCAKQLLKLNGSYMLEMVIERVLTMGFTEVVAVIGREAERIQQLISIEDKRFRWCVNPDFCKGQSTSLKAGIKAVAEEVEGIMIFLGDQPFISEKTIGYMYEEGVALLSRKKHAFAVQPIFQEKPGHPVFFAHPPRPAFLKLQGDQGAKPILKNLEEHILLPVEDKAILIDLDTPEDVLQNNFINEN